jgi:thiol:disulfide interchange protein DsbD
MKTLFALMLALVAAPTTAAPAVEEDLLEPDKAFALTLKARDARTLEARWAIAPGYYLYREKFKFEIVEGGARLGQPAFPAGIRKKDEFFGDVETYRGSVTVSLPLLGEPAAGRPLRLKVVSQGCADIGVCYPPQTKVLSVALAAAGGAAPAGAQGVKSLADLNRLIEPGGQREFLPADQAFKVSVEPADAETLRVRVQIADGYYLYRDKTRFELARGTGVQLGRYELPRGTVKDDPYIGRTEVYYKTLEMRIPLARTATGAAPIELTAAYQGCAENGICYPPTTKTLNLTLPAVAATAPASAAAAQTAPAPGPTRVNNNFLLAMLAAFGTGLLLTFTPCVLPMIPIVSSVIVGSADRHVTKLEGGSLSLAYVLGTAVTYTAAGVLAGLSGDQLQAHFQNPWAIGLASALFGLLALSMFGFYELQMPAFIQSYLHRHSADIHLKTRHTKVGAFIGIFGMGLLSALIVGACVSPLLIGALGAAIASRDPLLGGAIMFSMSLGMGMILIAIGIGAGFLLPKAGTWMNQIKHVFGVLLIAVAIYLLGLLPQVPVLLLWAVLLIVSGVYLGATQSLPAGASGWRFLWKGLGTVLLIWGVAALLGGFAGERDILAPLPQAILAGAPETGGRAAAPTAERLFERVRTVAELDRHLAAARGARRPVLLDYYADWCTDCIRMEKTTFADARVRQALGRFALIQADVTENDDRARALKQRFGVFGPPATILLDAEGRELEALRFYGFRAPGEFLVVLDQVPR